jgi:hypothetical protein
LAILLIWASGLLIGGLSVLDPHDDDYHILRWFGHRLMVPSLVVSAIDHRIQPNTQPGPAPLGSGTQAGGPVYQPSFGTPKEMGVLYTGLAGFLNLLVLIDVLFWEPHRSRDPRDQAFAKPKSEREAEAADSAGGAQQSKGGSAKAKARRRGGAT